MDYDDKIPTCYGKEPYASRDGREYSDVDKNKLRTINIQAGVGVETFALAERFLYDHYRFARLLDKKVCKGGTLFSFKVENE